VPGSEGRHEGEIRRILIDGRNVQAALARASGVASLPTHVFTSQVLAAVPPDAVTQLLLDGFPSGGVVGRIGPRLRVEFTKGVSADRRIAELVEQAAGELGPIGVDGVLVVSDDREVGDQARRHGARVVGTAWLTGRIGGGAAGRSGQRGSGRGAGSSHRSRAGTSLGHGRPPRPPFAGRDSR
jgi:hypothetical protein